jgi:hypothetical protein
LRKAKLLEADHHQAHFAEESVWEYVIPARVALHGVAGKLWEWLGLGRGAHAGRGYPRLAFGLLKLDHFVEVALRNGKDDMSKKQTFSRYL